MPKIRQTASEERRRNIRAKINYLMEKNSIKNENLAKLLGISVSTLVVRKRTVDKLTYGDLHHMSKLFGVSISEMLCEKEGEKSA